MLFSAVQVVVEVDDGELQLVDDEEVHFHSYQIDSSHLILVYDVLIHEHIREPR